MSIRNRKFSRRNYSSDAATFKHLDGAPSPNPEPFGAPTEGGQIADGAHQYAEGRKAVADMHQMQNHMGGCGDDFAKEG